MMYCNGCHADEVRWVEHNHPMPEEEQAYRYCGSCDAGICGDCEA